MNPPIAAVTAPIPAKNALAILAGQVDDDVYAANPRKDAAL